MSTRLISLDTATDGLEFANEYLTGKDKQQWGADHVPFDLHGVKYDDKNRYGARWILDVSTYDDPPENRKIGLNANPRRDQLMERLQERLEDGVIGPLELQNVDLEGGTSVWTLVPHTVAQTGPPF